MIVRTWYPFVFQFGYFSFSHLHHYHRYHHHHHHLYILRFFTHYSVCVCVRPVRLKRGIRTLRAKNWKKNIQKIYNCRPSTAAFRTDPIVVTTTRRNPIEPDDVGKNLANAIVPGFRRISLTLRNRFPLTPSIFWGNSRIGRHNKNH